MGGWLYIWAQMGIINICPYLVQLMEHIYRENSLCRNIWWGCDGRFVKVQVEFTLFLALSHRMNRTRKYSKSISRVIFLNCRNCTVERDASSKLCGNFLVFRRKFACSKILKRPHYVWWLKARKFWEKWEMQRHVHNSCGKSYWIVTLRVYINNDILRCL